MKVGIVTFPGSNCDHDAAYAFGQLEGVEIAMIWHKETSLFQSDLVVLPGGFSYGDYLRAGCIAQFSPVMEAVVRFAREGGPVLGICNGFQVLTEAQLLPGALAMNLNQRFVCKDVYLTPGSNQHFMTRSLPSERLPLRIPIAHAEGRYLADEQTLDALEAEDRVLFYYCNSFGERSASANPNGSSRHIAGICNSMGNVIGMMPHPERAADAVLGNTDGQLLLSAFLSAAFATPT